MKPTHLARRILLSTILLGSTFLTFTPTTRAGDQPKTKHADIYDESLDGSKQISAAIEQAKKDHKNVILQFGANWCGWCHRLHTLFETDPAITSKLKSDFVVVMVDVNKGHNESIIKGYKADGFGLPVIVVLDSNGKQLTTKDTGQLEEGDHHDPKKVLAFLNEWSPKQP